MSAYFDTLAPSAQAAVDVVTNSNSNTDPVQTLIACLGVMDVLEYEADEAPAPVHLGRSNSVKTAKGTKIETRFALVEADTLIASHDSSGGVNAAFPQELQPRDRSRETSQAWVQKVAASLDPDSLGRTGRADTGAPIVGSDMVVESGNGRTMAIKLAYQRGTAEEYRDWLTEEAEYFGFQSTDVEAMREPVLVRVRQTEIDRRVFAVEANQDDKLSFTATERAKSDSKRLDENLLSLFAPSEDGDLNAASNFKFIQSFLKSLGETESAQYITKDGKPTQALIQRIKAAVFSKAYGDDRLLEMIADQTRPELQNVLNALSSAAPKFIEAQSYGKAHVETVSEKIVDSIEHSLDERIVNAIVDATNVLMSAKVNNQDVAEFVKQQGLFGDLAEGVPELAVFLAKNNRSAKKMAIAFKAMADFVKSEAVNAQNESLFGDPVPPTMLDVVEAANRALERVYGKDGAEIDLFDSAVDDEIQALQDLDVKQFPIAALELSLQMLHAVESGHSHYIKIDLSGTYTIAKQDEVMDALNDGTITVEDYRAAFAKLVQDFDSVTAEASKMTKVQLCANLDQSGAYYDKNRSKDDLVENVVDRMLRAFSLKEMFSFSPSYGGGRSGYIDSYVKAVQRDVDNETQQSLDEMAARIAVNRKERADLDAQRKAGLENPQSLSDYSNLLRSRMEEQSLNLNQALMTLTPEQRELYDSMAAKSTREKRVSANEARKTSVSVSSQTTSGTIIEAKHTKYGHDLFVVQLAERLDRDAYNTINAQAKKLGGYYSSFRGNGAVVGFQFKDRESAEAFLKLVGGDATDANGIVEENRNAFIDDKNQSAVERLTEMSQRLLDNANEQLNRDRKVNTHRRAGMAARAEAAANADKALALTMKNIADAIQSGRAEFLDKVRQKTQVEFLKDLLASAKSKEIDAKYGNDTRKREEARYTPETTETVDYVVLPLYRAYKSDLAGIARKLVSISGTKRLGQELLKLADDTSAAYEKWAKANFSSVTKFVNAQGTIAATSTKAEAVEAIYRAKLTEQAIPLKVTKSEYAIILSASEAIKRGIWNGDDKIITIPSSLGEELVEKLGSGNRKFSGVNLPWSFESTYASQKKMKALDLNTGSELRTALREFVRLSTAVEKPDPIKALERAMVGRVKDGLDFFPTPQNISQEMLDVADIKEGMTVLEPSAGMGHIAEMIRDAGVDPDVIEYSAGRRELLEAKGFNVVGDDFLKMTKRTGFTFGDTFRTPEGLEGIMRGSNGGNRVGLIDAEGTRHFVFRDTLEGVKHNGSDSGYDRIIMNPPFSNRRDVEHVQHAYSLLNAGGRLVSIMGEGAFFGQDQKAVAFRDWLERVGGTSEKLGEGSFNDPSLPVTTSVNTRLVVIQK